MMASVAGHNLQSQMKVLKQEVQGLNVMSATMEKFEQMLQRVEAKEEEREVQRRAMVEEAQQMNRAMVEENQQMTEQMERDLSERLDEIVSAVQDNLINKVWDTLGVVNVYKPGRRWDGSWKSFLSPDFSIYHKFLFP